MKSNQKQENKDKESGLQSYARYSGLAVQMIVIILAFVWAGKKIDEKYFGDRSVFVIIFSLAGVAVAMYVAIKDLLKSRNKK